MASMKTGAPPIECFVLGVHNNWEKYAAFIQHITIFTIKIRNITIWTMRGYLTSKSTQFARKAIYFFSRNLLIYS